MPLEVETKPSGKVNTAIQAVTELVQSFSEKLAPKSAEPAAKIRAKIIKTPDNKAS